MYSRYFRKSKLNCLIQNCYTDTFFFTDHLFLLYLSIMVDIHTDVKILVLQFVFRFKFRLVFNGAFWMKAIYDMVQQQRFDNRYVLLFIWNFFKSLVGWNKHSQWSCKVHSFLYLAVNSEV